MFIGLFGRIRVLLRAFVLLKAIPAYFNTCLFLGKFKVFTVMKIKKRKKVTVISPGGVIYHLVFKIMAHGLADILRSCKVSPGFLYRDLNIFSAKVMVAGIIIFG